jgi:hypothetical protein
VLASFRGGSILPIFRPPANLVAISDSFLGWRRSADPNDVEVVYASRTQPARDPVGRLFLPTELARSDRPARWDVPEWLCPSSPRGHDRSVIPALLERHRYRLSESSPTSCDPVSISDSQAWIASTTASSCVTVRLR